MTITVTADVPPELDEALFNLDVPSEIARLLAQLEHISVEEVEAQVHQKMIYLLCPSCRAWFVKNPLGRGEETTSFLQ